MNNLIKALVIAIFTLLASACQTVQHATPSGRPEATIKADPVAVKSALAGALFNFGYTMVKDTNFQMAMDKPIQNVMANVLMGSQYDPTVEARINATFLQMGDATRVTAELFVVRNGGSAFEALTPMNGAKDSIGVQSLLDDIKAGLEAGKDPGQVVAEVSQRDIGVRAGLR